MGKDGSSDPDTLRESKRTPRLKPSDSPAGVEDGEGFEEFPSSLDFELIIAFKITTY